MGDAGEVWALDDLSALEANRDGVTGFEDTELIISGEDRLCLSEYRHHDPQKQEFHAPATANDEKWRAVA